MKTMFIAIAAVLAAPASVAHAATAYNSTPATGWFYGAGNDYSPANTAVLSSGADQLYLRWHLRGDVAPASTGSVYSFALGTQPLSFDWGFDATTVRAPTAKLTITNLTTGANVSYDPLFVGNDNATNGAGTYQNSAHLGFAFLSGVGFNANVDNTYRVRLDVNDIIGGPQSLYVDARIGAGALAPIPEPATWAMMIGGFGMAGAAMRRRTTKVVFA